MFVPVKIDVGAGGQHSTSYDRRLDVTIRQFEALQHEAGDMTEPFTSIGADLRMNVSAQFATEGAGGATGPWAPLSEPYAAWKAARSGAPILVGLRPLQKGTTSSPTRPEGYAPSGEMRRELLDPTATHVTPRRLLYQPVSDIAGYHQSGTETMPARPPVDLGPTFLRSIDRHFVRWINTLVERHDL